MANKLLEFDELQLSLLSSTNRINGIEYLQKSYKPLRSELFVQKKTTTTTEVKIVELF